MEKSIHSTEYALLRAELRAARDAAGCSQRELALRLKVPHSWIAKVETGERRIDLIEFGRFMTACGGDANAVAGRIFKRITVSKSDRTISKGRSR